MFVIWWIVCGVGESCCGVVVCGEGDGDGDGED